MSECLSTRSVRALLCSRRALGIPREVSFVSGVAAQSLSRGPPRSAPSLRSDSQRPPTPVRLALRSRALSLSLETVKNLRSETAGLCQVPRVRPGLADVSKALYGTSRRTRTDSHFAFPASGSDGLVPTVRTLGDLFIPGSSSQEHTSPLLNRF